MEVLLSFLTVAALFFTFVDGAGYLQVRPPTLGQCYYEDINKAHFSYNRTFCEGHAPEFNVVPTQSNADRIILFNVPGRPNKKKYVFGQLHVHFGRNDNQGSEHCIDNIFKPMEAHLVFYDLDYGNLGDARSKKDGLVVLSVMIENGRKCKARFAKNLSNIMEKYYEQVRCFPLDQYSDFFNNNRFGFFKRRNSRSGQYCGRTLSQDYIQNRCQKDPDNTSLKLQVTEGLTPKDVLPYDTDLFYTYAGSLTTPPCYETVQWIIYKCPIKVSSKAFNMLQFVEDSQKDELIKLGVRRPIQVSNITYLVLYLFPSN
ncbi:CA [Mytilus coruscus]|uniref:CA n=1 Tax=Mytilus coruscus TaxID=42192 RepID=A0A6J8ECW5_MYTCO|nr:CA [Mytilus coruscus]